MPTTTELIAALAVTEPIDPDVLAQMVRPLTAEEDAEVDDYLAQIAPLDDEALAAELRIPAGYVAQFRELMYPAVAR